MHSIGWRNPMETCKHQPTEIAKRERFGGFLRSTLSSWGSAAEKRNKRAALKLMRKLLKKFGFVPDKLVTDNLRSYAAAAGQLGIAKRHERGQWRNNRAENSHQPTRRRERKMQG